MTSEHVNSFVTDLVQMAKAMERVPQLEQDVSILNTEINRLELRNTDLAVSLEVSRIYCASLEQRLHDAEVAVTAAELRFLECDDAKGTLVRVLEGFMADAKGVLAAIAPIPEPVTEPDQGSMYELVREQPPLEPLVHTDISLQDGPLNWRNLQPDTEGHPVPFVPPPTPDATPSTDASSSEGTEGESASPLPVSGGETHSECANTSASTEGVSVPSDPTSSAKMDGSAISGSVENSNNASTPDLGPYYDYNNGFSNASHNS